METNMESIREREEEVCRLCAKKSKFYVSIFGENNFCVPEKISRCLSIIVLSNDKLPLFVCKCCLQYLNISYRLIVTSIEADIFLRKQFDESHGTIITENQDMRIIDKSLKRRSKNKGNLTLKELKRQAMIGPAECELCNVKFQNVDEFDSHMESVHLHKWKCNLCDDSFEASTDLISHKTLTHDGNIAICRTCVSRGNEESDTTANILPIMTKFKEHKTNEEQMQQEGKMQDITEEVNIKNSKDQILHCTVWKKSRNSTKMMSNKTKKSLMLFCASCNIYFGDEHHFTAHKKIHESKRMICIACCIECPSMYDLFLHKRMVHNMYKKVQLKYVCDKCGKFFTNSWQWQSHKGNECLQKPYDNACKYCKNVFSTNHKLMRHLRKHKTEMFNDPTVTVYKCIACPKIFVDKEFYQKHRNVHDPECWDKFRCVLCNRPFRDNVRLREHQLSVHEGIKPHRCDICGRTFHRLYNMKVHRTTHLGCKCIHCDSVFNKLRDLIMHIQNDHGLKPDIKKLTSKVAFRNVTHMCRYCGKKLASYQSLINHEHIHTGEKPYTCKICHKSFRSCTSRWAHTQRHKKGNFICEHCGKCFGYKQNLSIHIRTHLPIEDRKYQCSTCGKKFLRKCHLNIHARIHDGIRPYTCDICLSSFTQKGDMRRHKMRHTKEVTKVTPSKNDPTNVIKAKESSKN